MPSVCLYFQVHQPYRLKPYSCFQIGEDHYYEDETKNREILKRVSKKCYLPTNKLLLDLINQNVGKFKIAFSITGTAWEQFEKYEPKVCDSFVQLFKTGCVELLCETYYHSLSFKYSAEEFIRQVDMHRKLVNRLTGQTPKIFRNTELIYNNRLATLINTLGFKGVICEGVDRLLGNRSPNFVYNPPAIPGFKCLLKNYKLSDDIAFRFSDKNWNQFPLTADRFAHWVHQIAGGGEIINLFMDYETFGEHQWKETGIFDFLKNMPREILKHPDFDFKTPSDIIESYSSRGEYDVPYFTSWADTERDLSAWLGNDLQQDAAERIYQLERQLKDTKNPELISSWAKLLTSDHLYYMSTKYWNDGDVHKYFSPYDSPYDAYINFMNIAADLEMTSRNGRKVEVDLPQVSWN
ncbi:MAG: polysaccharide deacetylase family protein [Bacteroidetes bacterium]|nr:polysaccharide deacetylase family protein [Bacteroidota bacterium]